MYGSIVLTCDANSKRIQMDLRRFNQRHFARLVDVWQSHSNMKSSWPCHNVGVHVWDVQLFDNALYLCHFRELYVIFCSFFTLSFYSHSVRLHVWVFCSWMTISFYFHLFIWYSTLIPFVFVCSTRIPILIMVFIGFIAYIRLYFPFIPNGTATSTAYSSIWELRHKQTNEKKNEVVKF